MTIDEQLTNLLDRERALRDATTDPGAKGRLDDQIEGLDEQLESLIDGTWDTTTDAYKAASNSISKAAEAAGAAQANLAKLDGALAAADQAISALAVLIGA
jgi:hypothetical protein